LKTPAAAFLRWRIGNYEGSMMNDESSHVSPLTSHVFTLLIACAKGIPPYLKAELTGLGFPIQAELEAGVETCGTLADAMRLNLVLHTGNRVLLELDRFTAYQPDDLYARIQILPWEDIIPDNGYFTVTSFINTPAIRDSRFANVKTKDAIVDRIRAKTGVRPDSGNERSGTVVFLYWNQGEAKLYIDTSGEALSRRGYRKIPMAAPMAETLAAAVVCATGWTGEGNFINPMCGSGTLAIEAALLAQGRPPGLLRSNFGFMHLKGFDDVAWQKIRQEARVLPKRPFTGKIIASDIRTDAVEAARQNARTAGVEQLIEFTSCDFADTPLPEGGGVVLFNPEYGERMGDEIELEPVYRRIGDFFKQKCGGYTGYVFTGNLILGKKVGLRSSRRILFFNANIECRLLAFTLYTGTKRQPKEP
jgi:putative N6-adenine-specific DNA methylase